MHAGCGCLRKSGMKSPGSDGALRIHSLPFAQRRGGSGRGALRSKARQPAQATAKATPSQPPPWLRQRGGAKPPSLASSAADLLPPLRNAQGRVGEGCSSLERRTMSTSNGQSHPLPTSPLAAPKGRGKASLPCIKRSGPAPSLAQRAGEGWGGVLFAGTPNHEHKQRPKPLPPNLPLGYVKGEGPTQFIPR